MRCDAVRGLWLPGLLILACTGEPISLGDDGSGADASGADASGGATSGSEGPVVTGSTSLRASGSGDTGAASTVGGSGSGDRPDGGSIGDGTTTGPPPGDPTVLFVNFDGVTLFGDIDDDATLDQALLAKTFSGFPLQPYGVGSKRDQIMLELAEDWAPFNVAVTQTRPTEGDYAMVVVTPTNPFGDEFLGAASQDCGDINPRSVGIVFAEEGDTLSASLTATAIGHQAGRGYGLESVSTAGDIMASIAGEDAAFLDVCLPGAEVFSCGATHAIYCPLDQQNSYAELWALFPK